MSISSRCANNSMDCPPLTNLAALLFDLRQRFRQRLCLSLNVQQTLAHNCSQVSQRLHWCFRSQTRHICRFSEKRTGWLLTLKRSHRSYNWIFGFWLGLLGVFTVSEPKSFIQSWFKEIFGGGRGDAYTFSYMTPPVSIRTTFGIQWAGGVS